MLRTRRPLSASVCHSSSPVEVFSLLSQTIDFFFDVIIGRDGDAAKSTPFCSILLQNTCEAIQKYAEMYHPHRQPPEPELDKLKAARLLPSSAELAAADVASRLPPHERATLAVEVLSQRDITMLSNLHVMRSQFDGASNARRPLAPVLPLRDLASPNPPEMEEP